MTKDATQFFADCEAAWEEQAEKALAVVAARAKADPVYRAEVVAMIARLLPPKD